MKTVGIMQPYFLPYVGYWQLIAQVDTFVVYDNLKYTKKGWINRNRILRNGKEAQFSIALKSASDFSLITQRELSNEFDRRKLLNQFKEAYARSIYFSQVFTLLEEIVLFDDNNLFAFLLNSIKKVASFLSIDTKIVVASTVQIDHELKGQDKVLAICKALEAGRYVNSIGGLELYSDDAFSARNLKLQFIRPLLKSYEQPCERFVPGLSIVDALMMIGPKGVRQQLMEFEMIDNENSNVSRNF